MSESDKMGNTDNLERQTHANPGAHAGSDIRPPLLDAPMMASPMNFQNNERCSEQSQQIGATLSQSREILYNHESAESQFPQTGQLHVHGPYLLNEHLQYTSQNVMIHSNDSMNVVQPRFESVPAKFPIPERSQTQVMMDPRSQNAQGAQKLQQNQSINFHPSDGSKQSLCNPTNNNTSELFMQLEAPAWVNTILQSVQRFDNSLQNIHHQLSTQNTRWQQIDSQLQSQNTRIYNIEQRFVQISEVKQSLGHVTLQVSSLDNQVGSLNRQMNEYDQSINAYSEFCDEVKAENMENKRKINDLHKRITSLENAYETVKSKHDEYDERLNQNADKLTDIQWRSMRENLIFTGIDEETELCDVKNENCERKIHDFVRRLGLQNEISFDRVHRIGKYNPEQSYPRPIVAKFHNFKDREKVRQAAPTFLKGTKYGVREQFPTEMENTRKLLYPVMKKAKGVEGNKVRLVRDKLFINDIQYMPPSTETQDNSGTRPKTYYHNKQQRGNQRNYRRPYQRNAWGQNNTRTFYSSRQPYQPFNIDMSNRFERLAHPAEEACSGTPRAENTRQTGRKNPVSSPLENDNTKKICEDNEYTQLSPPTSPSAAPKEQMDTNLAQPNPLGSPSVSPKEPMDTQILPKSENPITQNNDATETGSISHITDTVSNNADHGPLEARDILPPDDPANDSEH